MSNVQVAKLSLVDGQRRATPPEMGQIAARGGTLYVLVEVSAPTETWDQASRQIVSKAVNTFARSGARETAALQAAVDAVNEMLLAQNRELPRDQHVWAGFNAAFILDDHLYLAQAGPALTYVARGDSVTRFPKNFDELETGRMEALLPLGERPAVKCRLAHFVLEPDDMIVMAASHLPTLAPEAVIAEHMQGESATAIIASLDFIAKHNDFSAYAIQYEPSHPYTEAPALPPQPVRVVDAPVDVSTEEAWDEDEVLAALEDSWDEDEWEQDEDSWEEEPQQQSPPKPRAAIYTSPTNPSPIEPEPVKPARRADSKLTNGGTAGRLPAPERRPSTTPSPEREPKRQVNQPAGSRVSDTARKRVRGDEEQRAGQEPDMEPTRRGGAALPGEQTLQAMRAVDLSGATRRVGAALAAFAALVLDALGAAVGWWKERVAPRVSSTAPALDSAAHRGWQGAHHAWYHFMGILRGVLPGDRPAPPRREDAVPPPPGDGSGFLKSAAIMIPLLLLAIVLVVGLAFARGWVGASTTGDGLAPAGEEASGGASFGQLTGEAEGLIREANNVDEATSATLVQRALSLLNEAEPLAAVPADQQRVLELRQQAETLVAQSGAVARPPSAALATFDEATRPTMLVQGKGDLYLIDEGRSSVYRILVNPQQPVAIAQIQPLLRAQEMLSNGILMGSPQFITWVPTGGNREGDGLIIMTREGQLFDLTGDIVKQSDFAVVASEAFVAAEGYGGNFYLLDPTNKQIWKYVADAAGQYSTPPVPWIEPEGQQQFGSPVDLAIDGYIFLLDQNGQVNRYQVGKPHSGFALDMVTPPLTQPVALAKAPPETSDLFVADTQRVLRFDQNGKFQVEYRPPLGQEWGTITDIAVDAQQEMLYVLSNTGVYMVDLRGTRPAVPEAPAPASPAAGSASG